MSDCQTSCFQCFNTVYTVSHKKRATLFLIITLAFLGRFLYFLHQWKEEGLIYTSLKNLPLHPNYVSTLPGKTKTTYKQHILKSIITVRSIEPVVSNLRRKSSNVHIFQFLVGNSFISLLWETFSHSRKFLTKKLGLSSNSTYLTWWSNCIKQTFVTCDVMQLWHRQAVK